MSNDSLILFFLSPPFSIEKRKRNNDKYAVFMTNNNHFNLEILSTLNTGMLFQ